MISIVLFFFLIFAQDLLSVEYSRGTARNMDGKIVYIEKHSSNFKNEKLISLQTNYFLPNGESIGKINTNYNSHPFIPKYTFTDQQHNRFVSVELSNNKINVQIKKSETKDIKTKQYIYSNNMVAGQGLYNFLLIKLNEFNKNSMHIEHIKFLIPLSEDYYKFKIRVKQKTKKYITLRVEADNWFFRLIAPYIDLTYDIESNRLLKYEGPSNLLNDKKEMMKVVITYKYMDAIASTEKGTGEFNYE